MVLILVNTCFQIAFVSVPVDLGGYTHWPQWLCVAILAAVATLLGSLRVRYARLELEAAAAGAGPPRNGRSSGGGLGGDGAYAKLLAEGALGAAEGGVGCEPRCSGAPVGCAFDRGGCLGRDSDCGVGDGGSAFEATGYGAVVSLVS